MSVTVACPKCQSRYQVPQSAIGKRVQCKKCSHVFEATAVPAKDKSTATKSKVAVGVGSSGVTGSTIATEKWAQFGIEGPLKRPPEIFQPGLAPPPRDILGNHAADPGFLKVEELAARRAEEANGEESEAEDELAQIVNNPYANKIQKGKNKATNSGTAAKKKKKKKRNDSGITKYISAIYLGIAAMFVVMGLGFFVYLYLAEEGSTGIVPARFAWVYENYGEIGFLVVFLMFAVMTIIAGLIAKRLEKKD